MTELTIQEAQQAAVEVLKTITKICENNKFTYFLTCGSLIGAIRHKGVIPWDDDVDIMMPRPDHDALIQFLKDNPEALGENLKVFTPETCKDYPYMISRISDDRYFVKMQNEKPYGMGAFIDIYPLEGLGNDKSRAEKICIKGNYLSSFCFQATRQHYAVEMTKGRLKRILKYPVFIFSKLIGKEYFQKKLKRLSKLYSYDESRYVGAATWNSGGVRAVYDKKWFEESILVDFEDTAVRAPKQYDTFLKFVYGNYMQLPPEEERVGGHFYTLYRK